MSYIHSFQVGTNTFYIENFSSDLIKFKRHDKYLKPSTIIDSFSSGWIFIWTSLQNKNQILRIRNGNSYEKIQGSQSIFIPPFSIVEWKIPEGEFYWNALFGFCKPSENWPKNPVLFDSHPEKSPSNLPELNCFISSQKSGTLLEMQKKSSYLAMRTKEFLEFEFKEEILISSIAKQMQTSRTFLSRTFKDVYGISPVQYRHRLRLFEAQKMMHRGSSITEALHDSGFSDPAQFIEHFKKILGGLPSTFKLSKENKFKFKSKFQVMGELI